MRENKNKTKPGAATAVGEEVSRRVLLAAVVRGLDSPLAHRVKLAVAIR